MRTSFQRLFLEEAFDDEQHPPPQVLSFFLSLIVTMITAVTITTTRAKMDWVFIGY